MFQLSLLAQAVPSADGATLAFLAGPQFFIALLAGVLMAFAFQFVLTSLSVAVDLSAENPYAEGKSLGKQIRTLEAKVGGGTLLLVNLALFIACFLAVKLTLIRDAELGAIVSVVIWSAYFLVLVWNGSRAIGAVASAAGSTVSSGTQGIAGLIATVLGGRSASSQITDTVESAMKTVRQELQASLSPEQVRESLTDYVRRLQLPQPDLKNVSGQLLNVLNQAGLPTTGQNPIDLLQLVQSATPEELRTGKLRDALAQVLQSPQGQEAPQSQDKDKTGPSLRDRALQLGLGALTTALSQRVDLSDLDLEAITGQLNSLWQPIADQASQATEGLKSANPFSVIRTDIEHYLLNSPSWYLSPNGLDHGFREVLYDPEANPETVQQQLESINRGYFVEVLTRREGIQPDQVNDVADELELIRQEVLDRVRVAAEQERSQSLRHQVEIYLKTAPKEALAADRIQQDFAALLVDPQASYETLGNRLLQFDRDTLLQLLLAGRQDLSQEEADQILGTLIEVRDRFLNESQETWNQLQTQAGEFRQRVESYLRETNLAELTPTGIRQTLETLVNVPEAGLLAARAGLGQLDRNSLSQLLSQRQDFDPNQVNQFLDQFESVRDQVIRAPQQLTDQAREQTDRLLTRISDYLRSTNREELNPEGIQRDLQTLLQDPQLGISALSNRLSHVDRETLVQLLAQRQDLTPAQVNQIIDQVQTTLRRIARAPRRLVSRSQDRLRDFQTDLTEYLRHTNREELNPEGIRRDLQRLLQNPRAGLSQLGDRLSQVDRGTLVALLAQRQDVTEEEANQIVDQVLGQLTSLQEQVKQQAQKVQGQAQSMVNSVVDRLRTSLNSLDQPELNYEGIQRDVRKLFEDPQAGAEALRDRLSQFDRDTLVALLQSRPNISEEQANRIVDQIEAARDSVLHRAERVQTEAEKRIQAVKHQAKEQFESVQKGVALAAWWLFGTAITSVATSAIAGVLATGHSVWPF